MENTVDFSSPSLPLHVQRTVDKAFELLSHYLHQPGVAFTSTSAVRD